MKKLLTVWLLQTGEPLHSDDGNPRPMRAMNLADSLVRSGHNVVVWSSAFYHQEKRHRSTTLQIIQISPQLEIRLIPSPGYKKNIGLGRLWDHFVLARNLQQMLNDEHMPPDVAFVGYPPIETAFVMNRWLANRGIPSLLDLKDQWPSLFLDPLPTWLRPLGRLVLWPYFYLGRRAAQQAAGLSSMAASFLNWGVEFAGRKITNSDGVFPLTSPLIPIVSHDLESARLWWDGQNVTVDPAIFRVVFIGSHMSVFDFEPVRDAARALSGRGVNSQFVICGDGGYSAQLRSMMEGIPNVCFPGWVDRAQIEALAERSHAALAPYKNIENFTQNLPNKIIDALALGLPILSPLQGEVSDLIANDKVGLRYGTDSGKTLDECIDLISDDRDLQQAMAKNAVDLYDKRFSFEKVYGGLVQHLEALSEQGRGR
jgi:glycosyltransferase involved in cell wall biosynthesis